MSAWVVSKNHIDVLVRASIDAGLDVQDPTAFGRKLWNENVLSIFYRYSNIKDTEEGAQYLKDVREYVYEPPKVALGRTNVRKQVDCYDYQTCEHDAYAVSEARKIVQALERAYPIDKGKNYDNAPWGV